MNLDTTLSKGAGVTCHLEVGSASVTLRVPGHAMRGPLAIVPALNFITNADVFAVRELPRLTDEGKLTLARRMFKEGILQIVH